jgi:two-component sensor histidine kinase
LVLVYAFIGLVLMVVAAGASDWRTVATIGTSAVFGLTSLACVGPWLAVKVRLRNWDHGRELAALIAVLLLGCLLASGLAGGGRYLAKWVLLGDGHVKMQFQLQGTASIDDGKDASPHKPMPEAAPSPSSAQTYFAQGMGLLVEGFIVALLGGGVDLLTFVRQRRRLEAALQQRILAKAQAERNEAELKLSVLAAQIEPHFLFNTLAGVRSAISSDPARAVVMVDHLVNYLRATIPRLRSNGGSSQGRLDAQLEAAEAYLGLMRARIPRLGFEIDVDPSLAGVRIPPMTLISLVENAVKHGIEPKLGPGHVTVSAARVETATGPQLCLSVMDDGVGFGGTTSGTGIGLANIRERLQGIYGDAAGLSLTSVAEGGVCATIHLPIRD